jgi:protein involved in polysaccharide export with SLBB domain
MRPRNLIGLFAIALFVLTPVARAEQVAADLSTGVLVVEPVAPRIPMTPESCDCARARSYTLGPDDVLTVSVFNAPELTQEKLKIQPDGKLSFAMLPEPMMVAGKTVEEVRDALQSYYAQFYHNPKVSLSLVSSRPFSIHILGSVLYPGGYEFVTEAGAQMIAQGNTNVPPPIQRTSPLLSNVLVAAGGLSYDSDVSNILVENAARKETILVDLNKLLRGEAGCSDVYLVPGDRVFVPRLPATEKVSEETFRLYAASSFSPRTIPVRVFGYVNRPGLVNLDVGQSRNIVSAIAEAGGFDSRAPYFPRHVLLYRNVRDEQKHLTKPITVDPTRTDIALMPNDVIYVPQKVVPRIGLFFDFVNRMLSPAFLGATAYRNATGSFLIP